MRILVITLVALAMGFICGLSLQKTIDGNVLSARVYSYFGEDSYGEEVNHYLQSGDTSVFQRTIIRENEEDGCYNVEYEENGDLGALEMLTAEEYYQAFGKWPVKTDTL